MRATPRRPWTTSRYPSFKEAFWSILAGLLPQGYTVDTAEHYLGRIVAGAADQLRRDLQDPDSTEV